MDLSTLIFESRPPPNSPKYAMVLGTKGTSAARLEGKDEHADISGLVPQLKALHNYVVSRSNKPKCP